MDTKERKLIIRHRLHHLSADIERLYIKRENVERRFTQLELTNKTTSVG